jgi:hypothetical protein
MARKPTELRPLMARLPEALRQRLERAAERNARSMNAEMIDRLQASFERQDTAKRLLVDVMETAYGPKLAAILQALARALDDAGNTAFLNRSDVVEDNRFRLDMREAWIQDASSFACAKAVATAVLDVFKPTADIGEGAASLPEDGFPLPQLISALQGKSETPQLASWAEPIRKHFPDLGETRRPVERMGNRDEASKTDEDKSQPSKRKTGGSK